MLRLLHHPLCPNSRRVRVALNEKGIQYELEEVKYWERGNNFMALNPAGTLPVLLTERNNAICGAGPITEYLEEAFDTRTLIGRTALQKAETRRLTEWFADKFYREVTKNLVWEKFFKMLEGYGYPNSKAISAGHSNLSYHFEYIAYLTKGHRWLCGDEITMADITAAAQISVLDYFGDIAWGNFKGAKQWYSLVKSRPAFSYILNDKVPGLTPSRTYAALDF